MRYRLECVQCGKDHPSSYGRQVCGRCGGILDVRYDGKIPAIRGTGSFWDYESVLPECKYRHYEIGSTRLIKSHERGNVFLKLEIDNPTRSFKDRGSIIEVSKAVEYGNDEIVLASTGNMAYSVAHYANLAGLKVKVFLSRGANRDKVRDIRGERDSSMDFVNGDFTKAQKLAERYAKRTGAFLAGDYCYRKEGQKTVGYEVMDRLPNATHLIVPVGNATLISGVFRSLKELRAMGRIRAMPKIVAVQATGSDPLVKAFKEGKKIRYVLPKTVADAIAVGFPTFGDQALEALRETGGDAIAVSDREMEREQDRFYEEYGLIAEPAGVASMAALRKMKLAGRDKAVCVISGGNV
jgi:threonine synthase